MKNVIFSQLRHLHKSRLKFIVWAICMVLGGLMIFLFSSEYYHVSASKYAVENLGFSTVLVMFFMFTAVGDICAGDFSDKTIYNELLSGCSRGGAFFGRAVVAIVFTMIGSLMILCSPVILSVIKFGWGDVITPAELLVRLAVIAFPLLRLICTFICIAFIVRNRYVVILIGYGVLFFIGLFTGMAKDAPAELLGITSFSRLCQFRQWSAYGMGGTMEDIVDASLPAGLTVSICVWSLVGAAVFLFIGWSFFRRDDLN